MHRTWLHALVVVSWLFTHGQIHAAPRRAKKGEVQIKCTRRLSSRPPDQNYACTVDVLDVVDRDRWLVLPDPMEDRLSRVEPIVVIETDQKADGLVTFNEVGS